MISKIVSIVIIFLLIFSCKKNEKEVINENALKSTSTEDIKNGHVKNSAEIRKPMTNEDFLMIIDYIPLNTNYFYIKKIFPEIYDPQYYEHKKNSKYLDAKIFNKKVKIELQLSDEMNLTNIIFRSYALEYEEGDSLYEKLKKYYSEKYGNYKEEISNLAEDSDYPYPILHYSSWKLSDFDFNIGLNESHKDCSLVWRYQKIEN
jgi:hypothetical protein